VHDLAVIVSRGFERIQKMGNVHTLMVGAASGSCGEN
jgi:hypothetical protein